MLSGVSAGVGFSPFASRSGVPSGNGQGAPAAAADKDGKGPDGLTEAERKQVQELKRRDAEVRAHEQAHKSVGGAYASGPTYDYQRGPDGRRYAVGGQVQIDTSPERDPQATIAKMDIVKRAALAPAEPSPQDRKVAALADRQRLEAQAQLAEQQKAEREAQQAASGPQGPGALESLSRRVAEAYARVAAIGGTAAEPGLRAVA